MNMKALHTLFVILFVSLGFNAFCQGGEFFEPESAIAAISSPSKNAATVSPLTTTSARFHKRFPQLFTGMAIEIATSTYPMDKTSPVFRQFGNVFFEKLPEGGYSYLIMANFSSKEAALEFLQNIIKPKAEDARLIQYNEGNRKVIRE